MSNQPITFPHQHLGHNTVKGFKIEVLDPSITSKMDTGLKRKRRRQKDHITDYTVNFIIDIDQLHLFEGWYYNEEYLDAGVKKFSMELNTSDGRRVYENLQMIGGYNLKQLTPTRITKVKDHPSTGIKSESKSTILYDLTFKVQHINKDLADHEHASIIIDNTPEFVDHLMDLTLKLHSIINTDIPQKNLVMPALVNPLR